MGMLLNEKIKSSFLESVVTDKPVGDHCLGRIRGIGATFNEPTRNGRRYDRQLWVNVMNSDSFKEMMETRTCFGELDHPEERVDSSIKEVATVLTDMQIDDANGDLIIEMEILDTPQGRLLKELIDCGIKLGVSSRGLGDERSVNGETIIDPDTYEFFAFDVVCCPAVKSARPEYVESVNHEKLSESLSREIENAKSKDEVESIKKIVETINMPELASITEAINIKLESLDSNGDNISSKLEDELGRLAQENEKLKSELEAARSKLSANNIRLSETKKLLKQSRESAGSLRRNLQDSMKQVADLQTEMYDSAVQLESLTESYEAKRMNYLRKIRAINEKCHEVEEELFNATRSNRDMKESFDAKSSEMKAQYESDINDLMDKNSKLESQISKMKSDKSLVESRTKSVTETMQNKLSNNDKYIKDLTSAYIKSRCAQEGISVESLMSKLPEKYNRSDIDKLVVELSDRKRRLGKLPFVNRDNSVTVRLEEDLVRMSDEDRQTWEILTKSLK